MLCLHQTKCILLAGLISCGGALAAAADPPAGSIDGRVLNLVSGTPVRKALVTLAIPQHNDLTTESDADGRFQFTGLPAGTYSLSVKRAGFLERRWRPVMLAADNSQANVDVRLAPQGVISGTVLDEEGEPFGEAFVVLLKQVYSGGRKQWMQMNGSVHVSDAGEYRLANLTPGRYLVNALCERWEANNSQYNADESRRSMRVYAHNTYYPGVATKEEATPVDVGAGAEIRGMDVRLLKTDVPPSVHIRGKVGGAIDPRATIEAGLSNGANQIVQPPDYAFDLTAPPGRYQVRASVYSGGPEAYASAEIAVAGNTDGVILTLAPAAEITGRVTVAEGRGGIKLQGVTVSLFGFDGPLGPLNIRSDSAGKLVFTKLAPPGRYTLTVVPGSLPEGCYVKAVKLGGREVAPDDIDIQSSGEIEIVLSNQAGMIAGSITSSDGASYTRARATLIPADGNAEPQSQHTGDDGKFRFVALRPGKYKLFAWEQVEDGLWQDPEFRAKYDSHATEITIGARESQSVQLHPITLEEMN